MTFLGRRGIVLACSVAIVAALATAAPAASQPTILTLVINDVQHGDSIVLFEHEDALVPADDLRRAGVSISDGKIERLELGDYVSLRSLGIRFIPDLGAMTLRLTVAPDLLATTRVDLGRGGGPEDIVESEQRSLYVNYAVRGVNTVLATNVDAYGEAGLRVAGALALSTVTMTSDHVPVRGLSSLTWDDRDDLRRLVLGDQFVAGGTLGGSVFVGGVHLRRSFELDPYLVTTPAFDLRGEVLVPSTAEIYVNGALIRRVQLPPGSYDLTDLPITAGASQATVILRDALGREQRISQSFYLPAGLLRPGLSDYHVVVGARREDIGVASFAYDGPVALARFRRGLTRALTGGLAGEISLERGAMSASITTASRLGQLELTVGGGSDRMGAGAAASLSWAYAGRGGGAHGFVRAVSPHYATVDVRNDAFRPQFEARLGTSVALGRRISLGGSLDGARHRDTNWSTRASFTTSISGPNGSIFSLAVGRNQVDNMMPTLDAFATLSIGISARTRGAASHDRQREGGNSRIEVQRTLPHDTGLGYRLNLQTGEREQGVAAVQAQTSFGRYEALYEAGDLGRRAEATAAGGLVLIGGRIHATLPIERGFVLVQVPGATGVRTYLENKEVGRTNQHGELLVANALPYYGNRIAIDPADVSEDRAPGRTSMVVAPPDRGGMIVLFSVPRLSVMRGQLRVREAGKWVAPAFGELTVGRVADLDDPESEYRWSPIGSDGEFELDAMSANLHTAVIEWEQGRCEFVLEIPATTRPIVDLGAVQCGSGDQDLQP